MTGQYLTIIADNGVIFPNNRNECQIALVGDDPANSLPSPPRQPPNPYRAKIQNPELPPIRRRNAGKALEQPPEECGLLITDLPTDVVGRGLRSFQPAISVPGACPKNLSLSQRVAQRTAHESNGGHTLPDG